jgi:hypothetical protein
MNEEGHEKQKRSFDAIWSFLSAADRQNIRFANAAKLFRFS